MKKYLHELFKRRDLLVYLVLSGLKSEYRNTFLGYLWWILDPLMMGLIYYFLRVVVLGMEGENIGAFLMIGLVAWHWIKITISKSSKAISSKSRIITQVYLPKAIFPLSVVFTQAVNFSFGLIAIALFLAFYRIMPGIEVLWLPLIMFIQLLFLSALSFVLAFLCTFIRDVDNVLTHITRLWFWTSPVIYEAGRIPPEYSYIIDINPASALLMSYRNVLMYGTEPHFMKLFIIGFFSVLIIIYMLTYYEANEHKIIRAL